MYKRPIAGFLSRHGVGVDEFPQLRLVVFGIAFPFLQNGFPVFVAQITIADIGKKPRLVFLHKGAIVFRRHHRLLFLEVKLPGITRLQRQYALVIEFGQAVQLLCLLEENFLFLFLFQGIIPATQINGMKCIGRYAVVGIRIAPCFGGRGIVHRQQLQQLLPGSHRPIDRLAQVGKIANPETLFAPQGKKRNRRARAPIRKAVVPEKQRPFHIYLVTLFPRQGYIQNTVPAVFPMHGVTAMPVHNHKLV